MANMIREQATTKYSLRNTQTGMILSLKLESVFAAEQYLLTLPAEYRQLLEIVPVNDEGKQILFG